MSHTLLCHSKLTEELNNYVEEANKFVVNRPEDEKIKELMGYFKKNRPDIFDKIIQMIQELSKTKG
jgi:dsDNA-binding SOS-regulon protein